MSELRSLVATSFKATGMHLVSEFLDSQSSAFMLRSRVVSSNSVPSAGGMVPLKPSLEGSTSVTRLGVLFDRSTFVTRLGRGDAEQAGDFGQGPAIHHLFDQ